MGHRISQRLDHRHTIAACYVGYVTQAIVNNLGPLLFLVWHEAFGVSFSAIGAIVAVNFGLQLLVDAVTPKWIDMIGYRISMVVAHLAAAAGLVALGTLPFLIPDPFVGLLVATGICAVGGGLLEVLVSPVVEACPTENKAFQMSLLHSFYCWGHVAVVVLSTAGFLLLGLDRWPWPCLAWAAVPLLNAALLCRSSTQRCCGRCPTSRWWRRGQACATSTSFAGARSGCSWASCWQPGRPSRP